MNTTLNLSLSLSTDDISYLLELLNNERYTANANQSHAESLMAQLVASASAAHADADAEDAHWNDEEIEARLSELRHQW
jgi:hypothetical protein